MALRVLTKGTVLCFQQFYKVVPIKDIRNLYVTFPIPDLQKYYKSNPGHYLGHLIGHEGPGSLLSELKAKGRLSSLYIISRRRAVCGLYSTAVFPNPVLWDPQAVCIFTPPQLSTHLYHLYLN